MLIASVVESLFNFASFSRQEKMEREAEKFQRKADLRSHWLADKKALLDNIAFDEDVEQIQKATKMVDSVDADIGSKVGCLFIFREQRAQRVVFQFSRCEHCMSLFKVFRKVEKSIQNL